VRLPKIESQLRDDAKKSGNKVRREGLVCDQNSEVAQIIAGWTCDDRVIEH
jgi:hypothetical protein